MTMNVTTQENNFEIPEDSSGIGKDDFILVFIFPIFQLQTIYPSGGFLKFVLPSCSGGLNPCVCRNLFVSFCKQLKELERETDQ